MKSSHSEPNSANPTTNPEPLALSRQLAAKRLGISERTLWTLTASKAIPHLRIGARVLYPLDALKRWIEERSLRKVSQPVR